VAALLLVILGLDAATASFVDFEDFEEGGRSEVQLWEEEDLALFANLNHTTVTSSPELIAALTPPYQYEKIVIRQSFTLMAKTPPITGRIVIVGEGAACKNSPYGLCSISGRSLRRHFAVSTGGVLILSRLELRRGRASSGGSILVTDGGQLIAYHVLFNNNTAIDIVTGGGGAVEVSNDSSLNVHSSQFHRNSAGFGGAVDVNGGSRAHIKKSQFFNNTATVGGGAVSVVFATTVLNKGSFQDNTASLGGGVYADTSTLVLCNIHASKNVATFNEGNLYQSGTGTLTTCGSVLNVTAVQTPVTNCSLCN